MLTKRFWIKFLPAFALMAFLSNSATWAADIPETETVEIDTRDGVILKGTYYPSMGGKNAPVVVMLADEGKSRAVFKSLAKSLQIPPKKSELASWAVLTVDLRAQGDSSRRRLPNGSTESLGRQKVTPALLEARVAMDMEAIRGFLVDENDAGRLNLNRFAVVGVGMGTSIATNAAAYDWSMRQLNTGKQGQDIKALVSISPAWKFKGLGVLNALRQPGVQSEVAVLMMYGEKHRQSKNDAERIAKQLEEARNEAEPSKGKFPTIYKAAADSKLTGSALLKQSGDEGEELIARFLEQFVVEPEYNWMKRRLQ